MKCAVQIYMVLGGFHVYKSVFLGWVVGRINIAVNGEHNCGVPPVHLRLYHILLNKRDVKSYKNYSNFDICQN